MSFTDPIDTLEGQLVSQKEQTGAKSEHMSPSQLMDSPAYTPSAFLDQSEDGGLFMDKLNAGGSYPDFDDLNSRSPSVQALGNGMINNSVLNNDSNINSNQPPYYGPELGDGGHKFADGAYLGQDPGALFPNKSSNHQQLGDNFQSEQYADQQYSMPTMPGVPALSPSMVQQTMQSDTTQPGTIQPGNLQTGCIHPGNIQSGNVQHGRIQHNNIPSGNIGPDGIKSAGMHSGNIPGGMPPGNVQPGIRGEFSPSLPPNVPYRPRSTYKRNTPARPPDYDPHYTPPFKIDLSFVRRTMKGVNEALNVDLSGTEVSESALKENPNDDSEADQDTINPKSEMSHVRLISDACGYIVVSVAKCVLDAARDSVNDNILRGRTNLSPRPPIRKKRGGVLGFKELANRANLSPWHFHRVFRFVTGVTPKAYGEALWEYLMIQAGFDLSNEDLTITQALDRKSGAKEVANALSGRVSNSSSSTTGSPQSPSLGPNALLPNANTANNSNASSTGVAPSRISGGLNNNLTNASPQNLGVSALNNNAYPLSMDSNSPNNMRPLATSSSTEGIGNYSGGPEGSPGIPKSLQTGSVQADLHTSPPNQTGAAGAKPGGQNMVPLSGSVAPGRVKKASSRSRGARSRSRNRSQTQNQILSSLSIDAGPANEGSVLSRGRSFSRVTQRPYLTADPNMPPYYANGSAIVDGPPAAGGGSKSPDNSVPLPTGNGLMNNMNDDLTSNNVGMNQNVPDLNSLSLQQIEHPINQMGISDSGANVDYTAMNMDYNSPYYNQYGNLDGSQFYPMDNQMDFITSNGVPTGVSPSNLAPPNNLPIGETSGTPANATSSSSRSGSKSRKPSFNKGLGSQGIPMGNTGFNDISNNSINVNALDSTLLNGDQNPDYGKEQYDSTMNFLSNPSGVDASDPSYQNTDHFGIPPSSLQGNMDFMNPNSENPSAKNGVYVGHTGFTPVFDDSQSGDSPSSKENSPSNFQSTTIDPNSTSKDVRSNSSSTAKRMKDLTTPQSVHHHANSFHSIENPLSSIRESFDPPMDPLHDDEKYDRYGDLPDYFFSNGADHPLDDDYSNSDAFLSALVGDEYPPLLFSWNADDQNEFAYQY